MASPLNLTISAASKFATNPNNGTVTNCNVSGNISPNSGGIFGKCANNCKAINCFSTGNINVYGVNILILRTNNNKII